MLEKKFKSLLVICIIAWQTLCASDEKLLTRPFLEVSRGFVTQTNLLGSSNNSPMYIDNVGNISWNQKYCSLFITKEARPEPCAHNPGHIIDEQKRKFLHPQLVSTITPKLYIFPFDLNKTVVFTEQYEGQKRTFTVTAHPSNYPLRVQISSEGKLFDVPAHLSYNGPRLTDIGFLSWTETCVTLCQIDIEKTRVITCNTMYVLDDFLPKNFDPQQSFVLYLKAFKDTANRVFFDYPDNSTVFFERKYPVLNPPVLPDPQPQKKLKSQKNKNPIPKNVLPQATPYPKWKTICLSILGFFAIVMVIRHFVSCKTFHQ